jgi:hypothetical protein
MRQGSRQAPVVSVGRVGEVRGGRDDQVLFDGDEDCFDQRLLIGEVVIQRATGAHPRFGHHLLGAGVVVPLVDEQPSGGAMRAARVAHRTPRLRLNSLVLKLLGRLTQTEDCRSV